MTSGHGLSCQNGSQCQQHPILWYITSHVHTLCFGQENRFQPGSNVGKTFDFCPFENFPGYVGNSNRAYGRKTGLSRKLDYGDNYVIETGHVSSLYGDIDPTFSHKNFITCTRPFADFSFHFWSLKYYVLAQIQEEETFVTEGDLSLYLRLEYWNDFIWTFIFI